MSRYSIATAILLTIGATLHLNTARAANDPNDENSVVQATGQFYEALNALFQGKTEPMEAVWSHADDVTYMGPTGGMQIGWDQVLTVWQSQAAKKLDGQVKPELAHVTIGPDIAIVACYEVGENIVDGSRKEVDIRATNIFRRENGQWKMIGHHTDLLDFLE